MNRPVAWYTIVYMKILYSTEQVEQRIKEMAREIITQYANEKPLFVCLLRGAVPFTSQLMMNIAREDPSFHPDVIYMHASAYGHVGAVGAEAGAALAAGCFFGAAVCFFGAEAGFFAAGADFFAVPVFFLDDEVAII